MTALEKQAALAKKAAAGLYMISGDERNKALTKMADALISHCAEILAANEIDMKNAAQKGVRATMLDRLKLTEQRIADMAAGIREIVTLEDPVGNTDKTVKRPNGLQIGERRVPIGVVGVIYEARPNVTADAAALTLKTANAAILRGGSEAINSNMKIAQVLSDAATAAGMPEGAISLVTDTDRKSAQEMMRLNEYIDVLIPRGGAGLIKTVVENATVPVIETGVGNCHTYIDSSADINMALDIALNAKCSRPSVCNAMETLLVHEDVMADFLPALSEKMKEYSVSFRACEKSIKYLDNAQPATDEDYDTEFLDFILAVKAVRNIDEAIAHIAKYSTGHSEAIVTNDYANSQKFLNEVDAAAVYVNASTRFTDGSCFGLGAEIGISTQKLHVRGPMGLKALTTIKYVITGSGQIR
ncbi:MAG: glutamate-5-semialdehyde dehydrogenase [Clostridia bacterium]|nr:glutamate-5-semialdehyde dehydrogenase [Clostridia bacterium]